MLIIVIAFLSLAMANAEILPVAYQVYPPAVQGMPYSGDMRPALTGKASDDKLPNLSCFSTNDPPAGLTVEKGCVLTGTPAQAGQASFLVRVTDEDGKSTDFRIQMNIRQPRPVIESGFVYFPDGWQTAFGRLKPGQLTRIDTHNGVFMFGYPANLLTDDPKGDHCPTEFGGVRVLVNGLPAPLCHTSFWTLYIKVPGYLKPGTTATVQVVGLTADGKPNNGNILSLPVGR